MMNPPLKSENRIEHPRTIGKETTDKYAYYGLAVYFRGPAFKPGGQSEKDMMASFLLEPEVAPQFPYLNAVAERAELHQNPGFIRFLFENRFCVLYPKAGLVTPVIDRPHARSFVERPIAFLNDTSSTADHSLPAPLTSREREVLCILSEGASNNEISRMLNISPHTVKSHVIHIFNKLGVNDRTQAAVWAARHHLI